MYYTTQPTHYRYDEFHGVHFWHDPLALILLVVIIVAVLRK